MSIFNKYGNCTDEKVKSVEKLIEDKMGELFGELDIPVAEMRAVAQLFQAAVSASAGLAILKAQAQLAR